MTLEYEGNVCKRMHTVLISSQHEPDIDQEALAEVIKGAVILPVIGDLMDAETKIFINPTGNFVIGGPV